MRQVNLHMKTCPNVDQFVKKWQIVGVGNFDFTKDKHMYIYEIIRSQNKKYNVKREKHVRLKHLHFEILVNCGFGSTVFQDLANPYSSNL